MQVHVRTNLSDPFPEKIVRERLTEFGLPNSVIRRLRGAIASACVLVVVGSLLVFCCLLTYKNG